MASTMKPGTFTVVQTKEVRPPETKPMLYVTPVPHQWVERSAWAQHVHSLGEDYESVIGVGKDLLKYSSNATLIKNANSAPKSTFEVYQAKILQEGFKTWEEVLFIYIFKMYLHHPLASSIFYICVVYYFSFLSLFRLKYSLTTNLLNRHHPKQWMHRQRFCLRLSRFLTKNLLVLLDNDWGRQKLNRRR